MFNHFSRITNSLNQMCYAFAFSYPATVLEALLLGQIFNIRSKSRLSMDLHFLRYTELKNHIFSSWCMCVCMHVSVSVFNQRNSKANYSRHFKVSILCLRYMLMLFKTFYQVYTKSLCTEAAKEFEYITAYGRIFLLVDICIYIDLPKLHEISLCF